jgi:hypothetical protein
LLYCSTMRPPHSRAMTFFESALVFWGDRGVARCCAAILSQACADRRWNPALAQNIDKSTFAAPTRAKRAWML